MAASLAAAAAALKWVWPTVLPEFGDTRYREFYSPPATTTYQENLEFSVYF